MVVGSKIGRILDISKPYKPEKVWHLVVHDMLQRNADGYEKYNRYLQTDCPDDMLQHAYEEALDLAVYLKTMICQKNQKH